MTQQEIRKLLGGYAANTLTERERTALFEAALEDQNLFDALHNEDELRELLADPVSREQIRQALEPVTAQRRRAFWMRPGLIGGLIGAASLTAAAVVAIVIVTWHREPAATSVPTQMAQSQVEPKVEAPQPAPPIPAPQRKHAARLAARSAELAAPPAAGLALPEAPQKQGLMAGIAANAPLYQGPLVRTSVLRSGPSGNAVRIEVVSELAGDLVLYRLDAAGQWQRVFPANGPGFSVAASTAYQIPDDPIAVRGNQDKLRLVIEPAAVSRLGDQLTAGSLAEPRAPLVVEIAIGPN